MMEMRKTGVGLGHSCKDLLTLCFVILCLALTAESATASTILNIEEFETSLYSVEILEEPITRHSMQADTAEDVESLHVYSKIGQQYVCNYKPVSPNLIPSEQEEDPSQINIPALLKPLENSCISKTKDWWSYKICFGSEITQFHLNHNEIEGDVISLGFYESDQKWGPEELEKAKKSSINKYHTQQYVNGSICDLTGKPRRTEVRFSCLEGEPDHIAGIAELESCSYILFIHTAKVCHHPYLQPPIKAKPSFIQCRPLISQAAYDKYLVNLETQKSLEKEKSKEAALPEDDITASKKSIIEQLQPLLGGSELNMEDLDIEFIDLGDSDAQHVSKIVADTLQLIGGSFETKAEKVKDEDSAEGEKAYPAADDEKVQSAAANEMTNSVEGDKTVASQSEEQAKKTDTIDDDKFTKSSENTKTPTEENSWLQKETEALNKIRRIVESKKDLNSIKDLRNTLRDALKEQYDELMEEATQELRNDGEDADLDASEAHTMKKYMDEYLDNRLQAIMANKVDKTNKATTESSGKTKAQVIADKKAQLEKSLSQMKERLKERLQAEENSGAEEPAVIKLRVEAPKYEVELIDTEPVDVEETEPDSRRVIALIRPLQQGARREEKSHSTLQERYGKKWQEEEEHEEL